MYKQPISHENRLIDPTWCESLSCNSQISCSIIPALGSITAIKVEGNLSKDEVKSVRWSCAHYVKVVWWLWAYIINDQATDELVSSAEAIHGILRECLVKSYSGSSNPRKALKGIWVKLKANLKSFIRNLIFVSMFNDLCSLFGLVSFILSI